MKVLYVITGLCVGFYFQGVNGKSIGNSISHTDLTEGKESLYKESKATGYSLNIADAGDATVESGSESVAISSTKKEKEDVDKRIHEKTKELQEDYKDLTKLYEEKHRKTTGIKGPHAALVSNLCTLVLIIIIAIVWYLVCCRHGRCCCLCCYGCREDKRCCCSCCCASPLAEDEEEEPIIRDGEAKKD